MHKEPDDNFISLAMQWNIPFVDVFFFQSVDPVNDLIVDIQCVASLLNSNHH